MHGRARLHDDVGGAAGILFAVIVFGVYPQPLINLSWQSAEMLQQFVTMMGT